MVGSDEPVRSIDTAERVFELIETIRRLERATFTEILEHVDMAESTLHDYLMTLLHLGYLTRENKRYQLSLRFFDHGISARENFSIYGKSKPTLEQLADESGEAVWLMVEENGKAVYLAKEMGERSIESSERLGKHEHMHCLASGKVMLAFSSEDHVEAVVDQHGLPQKTPDTITTIEELRTELDNIREQKHAINQNEAVEGISAVAAPVLTDGHVRGAVTIATPVTRLENETHRQKLLELVTTGANEIEVKMIHN